MKQLTTRLFLLLVACFFTAQAQIRVLHTETLPLARSGEWSDPRFSPNGKIIYFTKSDGDGIWEYTLATRTTRQLTSDPKSGFAYNISADGKSLMYRRTLRGRAPRARRQEVVLMNIARKSSTVLAAGSDVSVPAFAENTPVFSVQSKTSGLRKTTGASDVLVLGIENTKIALSINGTKTLLDPLKNGSYIWPMLSPDKTRLVAYEMDRGAFVCDLRGNVQARLGRRDAPSWTRSGKWIVFMDDKDDGHRLLSSDIAAVSADGAVLIPLTATSDIFELNPDCSPTENKIVCNTLDGSIIVLEYEEGQ